MVSINSAKFIYKQWEKNREKERNRKKGTSKRKKEENERENKERLHVKRKEKNPVLFNLGAIYLLLSCWQFMLEERKDKIPKRETQ